MLRASRKLLLESGTTFKRPHLGKERVSSAMERTLAYYPGSDSVSTLA